MPARFQQIQAAIITAQSVHGHLLSAKNMDSAVIVADNDVRDKLVRRSLERAERDAEKLLAQIREAREQ